MGSHSFPSVVGFFVSLAGCLGVSVAITMPDSANEWIPMVFISGIFLVILGLAMGILTRKELFGRFSIALAAAAFLTTYIRFASTHR